MDERTSTSLAPSKGRGRFYITTPIFYVNGAPHLGTAYTMIVADALARWHRQIGQSVYFLTGTDEHGLKIAQSATVNGVTPKQWVDTMSNRFIDAWTQLGISNDRFIRTTEPEHYRVVQAFLTRIYENGYIYKAPYEGSYCVACEAYYLDSELLDGGLCPIHLRPVTQMKEDNYFFNLKAFEGRLLEWYDSNLGTVFPESRRNEALGFIRQGLEDISITRTSIDWGVPVPWDPAHVFYVWYDALINYISAIGYGDGTTTFEEWWPNVHHILGKDILRFHCVWWPAMLMAAGIEPPRQFIVHGWILADGEKMSKSRGNNVDPLELAATFGIDTLRFYLLKDTTLGSDGDFTDANLIQRYNTELANNYGNLLSRVVAVVNSKLDGVAPRPPVNPPDILEFHGHVARAADGWDSFAPSQAIESIWELIRATNAYLEATEPWKSDDQILVSEVLGACLEVLRVVTLLALPALPNTGPIIWSRIGLEGEPGDALLPEALEWGLYQGGAVLAKEKPVYPRLLLPEV